MDIFGAVVILVALVVLCHVLCKACDRVIDHFTSSRKIRILIKAPEAIPQKATSEPLIHGEEADSQTGVELPQPPTNSNYLDTWAVRVGFAEAPAAPAPRPRTGYTPEEIAALVGPKLQSFLRSVLWKAPDVDELYQHLKESSDSFLLMCFTNKDASGITLSDTGLTVFKILEDRSFYLAHSIFKANLIANRRSKARSDAAKQFDEHVAKIDQHFERIEQHLARFEALVISASTPKAPAPVKKKARAKRAA